VLIQRNLHATPVSNKDLGWAIVSLIFTAIVVILLFVGFGSRNFPLAVLGVLGLPVCLWPFGWAIWTFSRFQRRATQSAWIEELEKLELARGCGDTSCTRCARPTSWHII
jgi:hypothetical protein